MDRPAVNREQAAEQRALKVAARADRPSQRACERDGSAGRLWTPGIRSQIQLRGGVEDGETSLSFEGFASVTGKPYSMYDAFGPYDEQVNLGAFTATLSRDPDVPLVLDHVSSKRIARTGNAVSPLELEEVTTGATTGLRAYAPSLQLSDPDTAYIVPKLRSHLIDEMSFRFVIVQGRWSDDYMSYYISEVDIDRGDVAIVGYGANPMTKGAGLRAAREDARRDALRAAAAVPSSREDVMQELERETRHPVA